MAASILSQRAGVVCFGAAAGSLWDGSGERRAARETAVYYVAGWAAHRSLAVVAVAPIAAVGVGPIVVEVVPIDSVEVPIDSVEVPIDSVEVPIAVADGEEERLCTALVGRGSPGEEVDSHALTSVGLCIL